MRKDPLSFITKRGGELHGDELGGNNSSGKLLLELLMKLNFTALWNYSCDLTHRFLEMILDLYCLKNLGVRSISFCAEIIHSFSSI